MKPCRIPRSSSQLDRAPSLEDHFARYRKSLMALIDSSRSIFSFPDVHLIPLRSLMDSYALSAKSMAASC